MQVEVYPKAELVGSTWSLRVRVCDVATGTSTEFVHDVAAGVTAEIPLLLLKLVVELDIGSSAFQDVDDSLFVDDVKPGGGYETVWGNWQNIAESILGGLTNPTQDEFWAEWAPHMTNAVRADARRAWVTGRGWTVLSLHQHQGDGSVMEE